jgi:putative ABC transport system substrate-binding protein
MSDAFRGSFCEGLRQNGYVEGRNILIEWRAAEGRVERLDALASDLVRLRVDVIVTALTPTTQAARKATTTIPIVMAHVGDPLGVGFVKSLARPGGNASITQTPLP